MKTPYFLITFFFSLQAFATDFSAINLSGWKKEELAKDHLRFTNNTDKSQVIHLQVDSYNPEEKWNSNIIAKEVQKMGEIRKKMSSFMGMKNYKITNYKYGSNQLELIGSYTRFDKPIEFKEINFYHREHFLQFKLISESKLPTNSEVEKIIREIDPEQVEID